MLQVRKPGRYLGNEWNVIKKDFAQAELTFAICFPDLYEIGMSNLGLRIIYGLLNEQEGICCERVFLPDIDMQGFLRNKNIPLFSLESKTPLAEFDFLGFCLNYELSYTNVLAVLDLAGIPLLAKERSLDFPLVIAGGSCVSNPEPLADFVDIFFIGEAEEGILEIVKTYRDCLPKNHTPPRTKEDVLKELAKIEGVYIPSLYEVAYNQDGSLRSFKPKYPFIKQEIRKRIVKNLDDAYYPVNWLVPYIAIVHDRAAIELMRGCPHTCNFCQARTMYQSLRLRSPEKVIELTKKIVKSCGYEEISFLSLSTSEYPFLSKVMSVLEEQFQEMAIAVSLPSLRPKAYLGSLFAYLAKVHKTTLTFAPEAGSERMRSLINKNFNMDEFYQAISNSYKAGWQSVKLYFMIGLPEETYEDLDGIVAIAKKVSFLRKETSPWRAEVHVSISFFVPKPHTAFEGQAMDTPESLKAKMQYLRNKAKGLLRSIRLDFHNLETSILEAAFSRGDRSLSPVLLKAYRKGCLLDGWSEHFKFSLWQEAFNECGKTMDFYVQENMNQSVRSWQHIDLGAST